MSRPERVDCHSFTTRASLWPPARGPPRAGWPGISAAWAGSFLALHFFETMISPSPGASDFFRALAKNCARTLPLPGALRARSPLSQVSAFFYSL